MTGKGTPRPGNGGPRPGAGRPRKEVLKAKQPGPVRAAEDAFRDALPELAKVALELALKHKDQKMVVYCINRALGAPTQTVDLDVQRAAARLAAAIGADEQFLIRRAQQLASENSEAVAQ